MCFMFIVITCIKNKSIFSRCTSFAGHCGMLFLLTVQVFESLWNAECHSLLHCSVCALFSHQSCEKSINYCPSLRLKLNFRVCISVRSCYVCTHALYLVLCECVYLVSPRRERLHPVVEVDRKWYVFFKRVLMEGIWNY